MTDEPLLFGAATASVLGVLLIGALVLNGLLIAATLAVRGHQAHVSRRRATRAVRWTPRLLAILSGDLAPAQFAASVWPHQHADALRFLTDAAVRLRADDRRRVAEAATPFLGLARRHARSRSPELRVLGVHALGLLSVRPPLVTLGTALRDPSRRVALAAARALAEVGGRPACHVTLSALSRFGGAHPAGVASLLDRFGIHGGGPILAALVHLRSDARAQLAAAEALQRLSYGPAVSAVREMVVREGLDRDVRAGLLRLLAAIGGPLDASVVRAFCTDPDPVVRIHAVAALGKLRCGPEDLAVLRRARRDPNGWVALRASEALGTTEPAPREGRAVPFSPRPRADLVHATDDL